MENQSLSQVSFQPAEQSEMNTSNLVYMNVGATEVEADAIDDLQFMDALLDHEANFVDGSDPVDPSPLSPMGSAPTEISDSSQATSSRRINMQHDATPQGATIRPAVLTDYQMPAPVQQHKSAPNLTQQQPTKAEDGDVMTRSVLTARLNHPFAMAPMKFTLALPNPVSSVAVTSNASMTQLAPQCGPTTTSACRKRSRSTVPSISEDEGEKLQRRIDRNQREQQRSQKITEQIACLKELLTGANVHFKPDKHSTLISVAEYIKQLQARSALLDSEHKKLLDTITKTNEVVRLSHNQNAASSETGLPNDIRDDSMGKMIDDEHSVFVKGLDYRNVFKHCSIPLAVASIDGVIMDCNVEFETLTGCERIEVLLCETSKGNEVSPGIRSGMCVPKNVTTSSSTRKLSLFNLLSRDDMEQVFLAMSRMLKQPISLRDERYGAISPSSHDRPKDFWTGQVSQSLHMNDTISINITLVRSPQGRPKFFQCALIPCDGKSGSSRQ